METAKNSSLFAFIIFIYAGLFSGVVQAQSPLQKFDDRVMINLMEHRTPEKTDFMLFMSSSHIYVDVGVPAGLLAGGIIGHNQEMRQNALFVASSTLISSLAMSVIKNIVKRPRPFVQNVHIVPVYRADHYSFPSGHTSSSFATASALSMAYPKWYIIAPSFLWAGTVGYSRMYLGVHYPTDVAAGAALGAGTAWGMSFLKK